MTDRDYAIKSMKEITFQMARPCAGLSGSNDGETLYRYQRIDDKLSEIDFGKSRLC